MHPPELTRMGSSNSVKRKLSADLPSGGLKKVSKQDCDYDSESEDKFSISNSE